jgi:hypothetical protein
LLELIYYAIDYDVNNNFILAITKSFKYILDFINLCDVCKLGSWVFIVTMGQHIIYGRDGGMKDHVKEYLLFIHTI